MAACSDTPIVDAAGTCRCGARATSRSWRGPAIRRSWCASAIPALVLADRDGVYGVMRNRRGPVRRRRNLGTELQVGSRRDHDLILAAPVDQDQRDPRSPAPTA